MNNKYLKLKKNFLGYVALAFLLISPSFAFATGDVATWSGGANGVCTSGTPSSTTCPTENSNLGLQCIGSGYVCGTSPDGNTLAATCSVAPASTVSGQQLSFGNCSWKCPASAPLTCGSGGSSSCSAGYPLGGRITCSNTCNPAVSDCTIAGTQSGANSCSSTGTVTCNYTPLPPVTVDTTKFWNINGNTNTTNSNFIGSLNDLIFKTGGTSLNTEQEWARITKSGWLLSDTNNTLMGQTFLGDRSLNFNYNNSTDTLDVSGTSILRGDTQISGNTTIGTPTPSSANRNLTVNGNTTVNGSATVGRPSNNDLVSIFANTIIGGASDLRSFTLNGDSHITKTSQFDGNTTVGVIANNTASGNLIVRGNTYLGTSGAGTNTMVFGGLRIDSLSGTGSNVCADTLGGLILCGGNPGSGGGTTLPNGLPDQTLRWSTKNTITTSDDGWEPTAFLTVNSGLTSVETDMEVGPAASAQGFTKNLNVHGHTTTKTFEMTTPPTGGFLGGKTYVLSSVNGIGTWQLLSPSSIVPSTTSGQVLISTGTGLGATVGWSALPAGSVTPGTNGQVLTTTGTTVGWSAIPTPPGGVLPLGTNNWTLRWDPNALGTGLPGWAKTNIVKVTPGSPAVVDVNGTLATWGNSLVTGSSSLGLTPAATLNIGGDTTIGYQPGFGGFTNPNANLITYGPVSLNKEGGNTIIGGTLNTAANLTVKGLTSPAAAGVVSIANICVTSTGLLIQCPVAGHGTAPVLTSGSGSWTVPPLVTSINIEAWGGGGSGGGGSGEASSWDMNGYDPYAVLGGTVGSGGGGGGYYKGTNITVTPGSTVNYTIGVGATTGGGGGQSIDAQSSGCGAAATIHGTDGAPGSPTTITVGGTTYTANGGKGGHGGIFPASAYVTTDTDGDGIIDQAFDTGGVVSNPCQFNTTGGAGGTGGGLGSSGNAGGNTTNGSGGGTFGTGSSTPGANVGWLQLSTLYVNNLNGSITGSLGGSTLTLQSAHGEAGHSNGGGGAGGGADYSRGQGPYMAGGGHGGDGQNGFLIITY